MLQVSTIASSTREVQNRPKKQKILRWVDCVRWWLSWGIRTHTEPVAMVLTRRRSKCGIEGVRRCLIGAGFSPDLRLLGRPMFFTTALLSFQSLWQNLLEKQLKGGRVYSPAPFQRFQSVATWPCHFVPETKPNITVGNVYAGAMSLSLLWPTKTEHVKGLRWDAPFKVTSSDLLLPNRSHLLVAHLPLDLPMD